MKKISILFVVLGCLVSASTLASWFKKSSEAPMATLTEIKPSVKVKELWSTSVGGTDKRYLKLTPALNENRLYAASYNGYVTAIDAQTGRHIWSAKTHAPLSSGVDAGGNLTYVGSSEGEVLGLRIQDGALIWRSPVTSEVLSAPYFYNNKVLVKSADDHLYAFDAQDGHLLWTYAEPLPQLILRGGSSPKAFGDLVVAAFADGQAGVFNLTTGQMIWKHPIADPKGGSIIGRMVDVVDNIAVADGVLYAASYQGNISAIDLRSGGVYWQHDLSSYAGLAVSGDKVYVTDADSHVFAFNRATGKVIWEQADLFGRHLTGPTVIGDYVVVADAKGYVHWLSSQDGHFAARAFVDSKGVIANPVVDGSSIYVYGNSGRLVKYGIS